MKKTLRLLTRIIALPFFVGLHGMFLIRALIYMTIKWLMYGGESIIYEKNEQKQINDIWEQLKQTKP